MAFQVSPGVNVSELDNTASIPALSTSIGGYVGNFRWGPVDEVISVSSESDLVTTFSAPNKSTAVDFYTAAYFLKYSNSLNVVRSVSSVALNANSGGDITTVVKNDNNYINQSFSFANQGMFVAKYPGALGNSLKVSILGFQTDNATTLANYNAWVYANKFNGPVGTSTYASNLGLSNDELHIVVVDEDGLFTGKVGTILETYAYVSQASDAKTFDGSSNYYVDVINAKSKYVWFGGKDATNLPNSNTSTSTMLNAGTLDYTIVNAAGLSGGVVDNSLSAGVDSAALSSSEYAAGWVFMSDSNNVDISLMLAPNVPAGLSATIVNNLVSIAEARKDVVLFVSPEKSMVTSSAIKAWSETLNVSSYLFKDSGRFKVYDRYNDQFINIPASSSTAGLVAETDREQGPWFSPAGLRRGQYFGVTQLLYNPSKTDRDTLYKSSVNPVVTFPGEGTILFGDKTGLGRPSAFDRINVRRLFIVLEKTISTAARSTLFEFNDEFTRAQFVSLVEPFLRFVQGKRGIEDFRVVADLTNNTPQVINNNQFVGDIFIKPARSINFINLNFVATRSGVSFNEISGG